MSDKYESRKQQIIDRYQESRYGLWNALLTINGIILATAAFIHSTYNFFINLIILILTFTAIALLTHNYFYIKSTYLKIGQLLSENPETYTEQMKENDIEISIKISNRIQRFEYICLAILCLQSALVIIGFIHSNIKNA